MYVCVCVCVRGVRRKRGGDEMRVVGRTGERAGYRRGARGVRGGTVARLNQVRMRASVKVSATLAPASHILLRTMLIALMCVSVFSILPVCVCMCVCVCVRV